MCQLRNKMALLPPGTALGGRSPSLPHSVVCTGILKFAFSLFSWGSLPMEVSKFKPFKGLTKRTITALFGSGRTFKRGRKFAAEGYLSDVSIKTGDGDAVVSASCWASQSRDKKHKVFLAIDTNSASFDLAENRCSCAAGHGRCSHQCAVFQYLLAGCAFARTLQDDSSSCSQPGERCEVLSCTSKPRVWGIPSRRIAPEAPVHQISFHKVPESPDQQFQPQPAQRGNDDAEDDEVVLLNPPEDIYSVDQRRKYKEGLLKEEKQSVLLRYFHGGDTSDEDSLPDDARDNVSSSEEPLALTLSSRFDGRRPGHIQYPDCMKPVLDSINSSSGEPTEEQVRAWCIQLEHELGCSEARRKSVCAGTADQASSPLWYKERVCRLTASKFGLICKRRCGKMESLVEQLLYTEPPVTITALHQGRTNEPFVVQKYVSLKEEDMCLLDVTSTGLHIHPTVGFLAASPDRLVDDSSSEPSQVLLEVKFLASVVGSPSSGIGQKSNFCLEKTELGRVQLKRGHNYYYQVQGQMACTGRHWCDFACMSKTGEMFCERVFFDPVFWQSCITKLTHFFHTFFAEEIVCPKNYAP